MAKKKVQPQPLPTAPSVVVTLTVHRGTLGKLTELFKSLCVDFGDLAANKDAGLDELGDGLTELNMLYRSLVQAEAM